MTILYLSSIKTIFTADNASIYNMFSKNNRIFMPAWVAVSLLPGYVPHAFHEIEFAGKYEKIVGKAVDVVRHLRVEVSRLAEEEYPALSTAAHGAGDMCEGCLVAAARQYE